MTRFRDWFRFLFAIVLVGSVICAMALRVRSRESFQFISSMAGTDDVSSSDIDTYVKNLEAMGMATNRVSNSDGVLIVGTSQESTGIVTISLRVAKNRSDFTGRWDGSFGIGGMMDRYRQRDRSG